MSPQKEGETNKLRTRVGYNFTVQTPFRIPEMADAVSYANAVNEALKNDGLASRYSQADIQALQNGTSPLANVDWEDQILRKAAFNHELNLSFDGSNQRMRYYVFANYTSNRGFFNNTDLNDGYSTQVEMYALKLRTNLEANISPTTVARMNLMGRLMQYQEPAGGTSLKTYSILLPLPHLFMLLVEDGRKTRCLQIRWQCKRAVVTNRRCVARCLQT